MNIIIQIILIIIALIMIYNLKNIIKLLFFKQNYKEGLFGEIKNKKLSSKIPPPFPNGWYSILHSHELQKLEKKYVSAIGENFVVYRGENNVCVVLNAYCPHLGANLGIGGSVEGNSIKCAFHGWKFNENGECTEIAYSDCTSLPKNKIKKWVNIEQNGSILVWYHMDEEMPTWYPENEKVEKMYFEGILEQEASCHIQEIPENGADIAHFGTVHKNGIVLPSLLEHKWEGNWEPQSDGNSHKTKIVVKERTYLFGKIYVPYSYVETHIEQIGPSLVIKNI
jgi:cholesterol 7-desaturase